MLQVALVCNSAFGTDGISMSVLNNHRYYKRNGISYHLIYSSIHSPQDVVDEYIRCFCKDGDKAQFISKSNGLLAFTKQLYSYLKQEKIDALHVNGSSSAILLEILVARGAGVKKIISHAHSTGSSHGYIHKILRPFVNILVDERLACGNLAGQWMYGKHQSFTVIPNCIDISKYKYDENVRKEVRKELGIEQNYIVLGHVGVFSKVKNQTFLLYLIKSLHVQGLLDYKLLLIGEGSLKQQVEQECFKLGLNDCVSFLGNRNDVPRLMMAMDIFCMPSLYEGFPITSVEAQATGLPLLMSSNVSHEVNITNLVELLPIDQGIEPWKKKIRQIPKIQRERSCYADKIKSVGYDIKHSAEMLEHIYMK